MWLRVNGIRRGSGLHPSQLSYRCGHFLAVIIGLDDLSEHLINYMLNVSIESDKYSNRLREDTITMGVWGPAHIPLDAKCHVQSLLLPT